MKKFVGILILCMMLTGSSVLAHPPRHHDDYPPPPPPPPPVVPVSTYVNNYQELFPGCDEHTLLINEVITEYSDRTTSSSRIYSVVDANGYTILANADYVEHLYKGYDHYFLVRLNGKYQIVDAYGRIVTPEGYISARIIAPDRIRVSKNLSFFKVGYGILDSAGNVIVPVKYQAITKGNFNNGLYITKLNGYRGLIDLNNRIFLNDDYDSITEFASTYRTKKKGKYGLVDLYGKIILEAEYDKITKTGDYITVKKGNLWAAYDSYGRNLAPFRYKKIKLDRNTLVGETRTSCEIIAK